MNATTQPVHIIIIIIIIIMSFLNIADPKKRDIIVKDYLTLVKELQQKNLNEKAGELARVENLKKVFEPVVQSTEKSTTAITKELTPLREEMRNLNQNLVAEQRLIGIKRKHDVISAPPPQNFLQYYLNRRDKKILDKYFGIQYTHDGRYMMGDKEVRIDKDSNIHVDGITYEATAGLWALVMESTPKKDDYTTDDFNMYANLVQQTNIVLHPHNVTSRSRYKNTYKWRFILTPILDWERQQWQQQQHSSHDHHHQQQGSFSSSSTITRDDDDNEKTQVTSSGTGIQFLPRDIKGLTTKLHLLLAEFAAGNRTSTRNEIVFILDELLKRKKISRKEYTEINSYLSRCL